MTPEVESKVASLVESIRHKGVIFHHLALLANHYQVDSQELTTALLTRQVMLANVLTDFTKPGNPTALSLLLKQQNALELGMAERVSQAVAKAIEAINTAENLQEEATRLLAKLRKEQEAKSK